MKPSCHECKHHREIPGDCHIQCSHPKINPVDTLLTPLMLMNGNQNAPAMKRLNVLGDRSGIRRGWFNWPLNFDPVWLLTCDGFEKKEGEKVKRETTSELSLAVSPTNATNATN